MLQVLHFRKTTPFPFGPVGGWSSLTRWEYKTLRALIDLWKEGHTDETVDIDEEFAKLMLDLAMEVSGKPPEGDEPLVKTTKLRDVNLFKRSKSFSSPLWGSTWQYMFC